MRLVSWPPGLPFLQKLNQLGHHLAVRAGQHPELGDEVLLRLRKYNWLLWIITQPEQIIRRHIKIDGKFCCNITRNLAYACYIVA